MTGVIAMSKSTAGMMETLSPHRFTLAEYEAMIAQGILGEDDRIELIHGAIVDMSAIGDPHIVCVNRLTRLFTSLLGERAIVSIQNPAVLPPDSAPQPDVVLFKPRDDFYERERAKPSDVLLVVEVADSSLRYDRLVKMPLYAESGIPEYWIADTNAKSVEIYTNPGPERYAEMRTARRGESIVSAAFEGISFPVDRIFG